MQMQHRGCSSQRIDLGHEVQAVRWEKWLLLQEVNSRKEDVYRVFALRFE